jgi:hypothetical protein
LPSKVAWHEGFQHTFPDLMKSIIGLLWLEVGEAS